MNETNVHMDILFTSLTFTFNKMGHCVIALQYYTLKKKGNPVHGGLPGPVNQIN